MVKFISLLGLFCIYFSGFGQKPSYYADPNTDLNQFQYFYMPRSTIETSDLINPFFNKNSLNDNNSKHFILYNELSLKNLTIVDDNKYEKTLLVYLYEGSNFESRRTPLGFKPKKIKGQFLIIDFLDSTTQQLVWRGWMDLKKLKWSTYYGKVQRAISTLISLMKIEPIIPE